MVRRVLCTMAVAAAAVLAAPRASADIFVNGIEGEVTVRGHEKEIQATRLTFGTAALLTSTGPLSNRSTPTAITITHAVDRSSIAIFKNAVSNTRVPLLKIEMTRSTGTGTMVTFLRISLKNARVVSLSQSGASMGIPTEQVSFAFEAATLQYYPVSETGVVGTPVNVTWDIVKGMIT